MPNRNYEKGRRKEYKIVNKLKEEGYDIVQRSAASHSPVDIWAINRKKRTIRLVQCKPDSMSDSEKNKLEREHHWLNMVFMVTFDVI